MNGCPICGYKRQEVLVGHCPVCNADVAMAVEQLKLSEPVVRQPEAKAPAQAPKKEYGKAALNSLKWGLMLGIPLALIGGLGMWLVFRGNVGSAGTLGGFEFGGLLGLMIGSIWGFNSTLETPAGLAALYGAVFGAVESLINYGLEASLVAVPDDGAHMYALMGAGAGAIAGWASMMLKEFRDER